MQHLLRRIYSFLIYCTISWHAYTDPLHRSVSSLPKLARFIQLLKILKTNFSPSHPLAPARSTSVTHRSFNPLPAPIPAYKIVFCLILLGSFTMLKTDSSPIYSERRDSLLCIFSIIFHLQLTRYLYLLRLQLLICDCTFH